MYRILRSEVLGYAHIKKQYENGSIDDRKTMNKGIIIFTVAFAIMSFENVFRAANFMEGWAYPVVEEQRPDDLTFSSDYEVPESTKRNDKLLVRMEAGPGLVCQSLICMLVMIVNNVIWVRRRHFSSTWHTVHYFIAAAVVILYLPRKAWWPAMNGVKYLCTVSNILIFQLMLG